MHSQQTPAEQVEREKATIRSELGRDDVQILFNDEGWDSRVYIVNRGEAVFKFPRSPEVVTQYECEIAVLRLLDGGVGSVRTPRVRWSRPNCEYFGYEGIVGGPLTAMIHNLPASERARLGRSIGLFLEHLHGLDLPNAPYRSLEHEIAEYEHKLALAAPVLESRLDRKERRQVEEFVLVELPATLRTLGSVPRLCHGDLGPWNLVLSDDREIGVIDFGDVAHCDLSKDFSGRLDDTVLQGAFDAYGADRVTREKAALRARALPVLDLLFFLGKADHEGLSRCLDDIRTTLLP